MSKRTYMVLDSHNSDAGFNPVEEAEIWVVNEDNGQMTHTGSAMERRMVESRVDVRSLIDACVQLFTDHEYSGKVAVVEADHLATLQLLLRRIGEDV